MIQWLVSWTNLMPYCLGLESIIKENILLEL